MLSHLVNTILMTVNKESLKYNYRRHRPSLNSCFSTVSKCFKCIKL